MILVIKHGALGDIIQATEAFRLIRENHKNEKITLLVRAPLYNFAKTIPFFDNVIIDPYPKINPLKYFKILQEIAKYQKVYDLQHSSRVKRYFKMLKLFNKLPQISTISPKEDRNISAFLIFKKQLEIEKIMGYKDMPCIDFMNDKIDDILPNKNFVLLIPSCSKRGAHKKWTPHGFAEVAEFFASQDRTPVFIGTKDDAEDIEKIIKIIQCQYINLCGKTNINQIASLARKADLAFGVDTGPIHIIAATGCKTVVLFNNRFTNAQKSLAVGKSVKGLEFDNLEKVNINDLKKDLTLLKI